MSDDIISCDVLVVGAGSSGVSAAVAAARLGCHTVLLERNPLVGGVMIDGFCFPVCGLFEIGTKHPPRLLNRGLCEEFYDAVRRTDRDAVRARGRVYVCSCHAALMRRIFEGWLDHPDLECYTGISDLNVLSDGAAVARSGFSSADGSMKAVEASQVIDCSGAGEVIRQSGAARIEPLVLPLSGYVLSLCGVDAADEMLPVSVSYQMRKAGDSGLLPAWSRFTFFERDPSAPDRAALKFNFPANEDLARVRSLVRKALQILSDRLKGFRSAAVRDESRSVLPREGSRLMGEYMLSEEDVRKAARFSNSAACGGWPMEYWDKEQGPQYSFPENASFYDIPASCLRSASINNLRAAGRCVSADSMALSSVRVSGTCIALGEAAARDAVA